MRRIIVGVVAIAVLAIAIKIIVYLVKRDVPLNKEKVLLLMEISRHGAREPMKLFNFTQNPLLNFNGTGGLLPQGKQQHYNLGQRMREKYIVQKGFLDANYSNNNILIQSSDYNRTYLSALYQLMGMFPNDQPSLEDYEKYDISETYLSNIQRLGKNYLRDSSFNITKVSKNEDYFILTSKYNCPRYEMIQNMTKDSVQYKIILDSFAENFQESLESLIGKSVISPDDMHDVCSYIYWAGQAQLHLKFTPQKEDIDYCQAYLDTKLYTVSYGLEELWKLGSYSILNQLRNISLGLKTSSSFELNSIGNIFAVAKTVAPKAPNFIHYSAHSETISLILEGIGLHDATRYNPGSALFIEFFTRSTETYVKFIKYDSATQTETILMPPGRVEEQTNLEDFYADLTHQLRQYNFNDVSVKCQDMEFSAKENEYYTGSDVLSELTTKYNLQEKISMKASEDF